MSHGTGSTGGKIVYQMERVPENGDYSEALTALILRDNVPERRTVYFDGTHSRAEEINFDYGVKSPVIRLREVGRATTLYCKEFPHVHFCVEQPDAIAATGPAPILELTDEHATVAGFACRKAIYNNLTQKREVFFTDKLHVDDPTGAVYRIDGVPGLIVQWQAGGERVTVAEASFAQPAASLFGMPTGFRKLANVDEARAEERRALDVEAAQHPATAEERARFVGHWRLATAPDDIQVDIIADGDAYVFRTTEHGKPTDERATMKGSALQVDEPPNFRLYRVTGDQLVRVGSDAWRFRRVP
ncbi:MAG TPA: hypothetical protein VGM88_21900 [Kofleriaceae bacterium]|jgi:hypothetical protein